VLGVRVVGWRAVAGVRNVSVRAGANVGEEDTCTV
jgi:hypothetical protein